MEGYGNENPGAFQPTRPLRGATWRGSAMVACHSLFQPTRPLRGATRDLPTTVTFKKTFQPTRPLRGATMISLTNSRKHLFQPTRPLRGATHFLVGDVFSFYISTHAPLAGRDVINSTAGRIHTNFNPRAPCGARLVAFGMEVINDDFNPRAPCGARPLRGCIKSLE